MTTQELHTRRPALLTRSTTDRKIGGVAGGLGAYFAVDPILFRIGFVLTTVFGGAGLVAYVALLVFVPADTQEPPPAPAAPQPST